VEREMLRGRERESTGVSEWGGDHDKVEDKRFRTLGLRLRVSNREAWVTGEHAVAERAVELLDEPVVGPSYIRLVIVQLPGFRYSGLRITNYGSGFKIQGSRIRNWGVGFRFLAPRDGRRV
jgi:hypothetical protein